METRNIYSGAKRLEQMYFSPIRMMRERAEALALLGNPVISFGTGEPDFDTPESIKEATIASIRRNETHYAPNRGLLALRAEISKDVAGVTGLTYDPETEIILTVGGAEAINNTIMAFVDPGDEVIVFSPSFMNYENMILLAGGTVVDIPLRKEDAFQINVEILKQHITDKTKMILINDPCNPTGVVYTDEVLAGVAEVAVEHDLLVFSDEIYNQITYDGSVCRSIATYPGMRERTIMMNGFSKSFAMTGWRLAYLATDSRLMPHLLKVHQYTTTCTPTFVQYGLIPTMNQPEAKADVKNMVVAFERRRNLLTGLLDKIDGLSYINPMGAFYCFVDVSATGLSGEEFASRLLEEYYVATVPGIKLGRECSDFIRLSFATSDANIEEGIARMAAFVKTLMEQN